MKLIYSYFFQNRLIEKLYGRCITKSQTNNTESQIIESADILKLQQDQKSSSVLEDKSRSSMSSQQVTPKKSIYNGIDMSNSPFKVLITFTCLENRYTSKGCQFEIPNEYPQ